MSVSSEQSEKQHILHELERKCYNNQDPIDLENFADLSVAELRQIVRIGEERHGKKHCLRHKNYMP